jgi:DNA-binding MarR family transcriptional regulator
VLVFKTLYHEGEMTRAELQGATHLSGSSVQRALATLADDNLVEGRPDPSHPRRRIYDVTWSN